MSTIMVFEWGPIKVCIPPRRERWLQKLVKFIIVGEIDAAVDKYELGPTLHFMGAQLQVFIRCALLASPSFYYMCTASISRLYPCQLVSQTHAGS